MQWSQNINGATFIRCEHHHPEDKRHRCLPVEQYHQPYLEALMRNDVDILFAIETESAMAGYGPLAPCRYHTNHSSAHQFCLGPILILFHPYIRLNTELQILSQLLLRTGENLAGMTARGASVTLLSIEYLASLLPDISEPGLGDLHVSFYNKSYLGRMIQNVKDEVFPDGNGWKGLVAYEKHQSVDGPENKYIATSQQSRRLQEASELMVDTSFKRLCGDWKEFTIDGYDSASTNYHNCSRILGGGFASLIFIMMMTFHKFPIQHNVAKDVIIADSHRGQALGSFPSLSSAQSFPKITMLQSHHTQWSYRRSLDAYAHLRKIYRLCKVHGLRNIDEMRLDYVTATAMKSLWYLRHPNWDGAIQIIMKSARAKKWLDEKLASPFALAGMCWEKSDMSLLTWTVSRDSTNVGEAAHMDTYREGLRLTLLVAMLRGRRLALNKQKSREIAVTTGIRETNRSGNARERATLASRWNMSAKLFAMKHVDDDLLAHNETMQTLHNQLTQNLEVVQHAASGFPSSSSSNQTYSSATVRQAERKIRTIQTTIDKAEPKAQLSIQHGSGSVKLWKVCTLYI
ncbi:hypothetical protein BS47DRAFT_1403160 [Hydnum rufescens UP504]|uniref:Uncharacterized protein n=1 Tax=Hydnum rufescens UP504 TaxID=1448309 RepID=A0A9P6DLQ6_9AGAM|nr:hypothetical protein BS47DRAFT_1403160 [Hydnum rufescens UP504]